MTNTYKFAAIIEDAGNGGAYVVVPFEVEGPFGKKRVKVKASIDGELYQGSLVRMGGSQHILGVLKSIRQKIGKDYGDEVEIILEEDTLPREILVLPDFKKVLKSKPEAERSFNQLSYTHQKEYVQWIKTAKLDETRQRRMNKAVEML
jgi:hypothetical protein